jgi:hypothetical protein
VRRTLRYCSAQCAVISAAYRIMTAITRYRDTNLADGGLARGNVSFLRRRYALISIIGSHTVESLRAPERPRRKVRERRTRKWSVFGKQRHAGTMQPCRAEGTIIRFIFQRELIIGITCSARLATALSKQIQCVPRHVASCVNVPPRAR